MSRLKIALLGGIEVRLEGGPNLPLSGKKVQALLAYLAMRPGHACQRGALMALLWGDVPEPQARHNLSQALFELRRALAPCVSCLVVQSKTLALDAAAVDVDVARFEQLTSDAGPLALEHAAALYVGDLLAGLDVDEPAFEDWLRAERERLRERAVEALARLLAHQMKNELLADATQSAVRLLALDPLQEAVHRTLMRLYVRQGRRASALHQYQVCVGVLQRELSVEPEEETRELYQRILRRDDDRVVAPDAPRPRPAPTRPWSGGRRTAGVPQAPFVGRSVERARLAEVLRETSAGTGQALLIVGEAGIGKSRLVENLAADAFDDGHSVLLASSYQTEQVLPLRPWVEALRASQIVAGIEQLEGLAAPWRRELARLFPELGDPGAGLGDGRDDYVRLFEAVTALLREVARRQPLTLVLDDLHWADDMSIRLFSFVGRRIGDHRILLVGTAREEDVADRAVLRELLEEFEREPSWSRLRLAPLSVADTSALVASLSLAGSSGAVVDRLAARVWSVSEGNPFVITEMVRALHQAVPGADAAALPLPPRVRDVISSRLERLSQIGRQTCAAAAVIGQDFTFPLLAEVAGCAEEATARAVEELVRRHVLASVGDRFQFVHDRIREVAYESLLPPSRRSLHAAVARAMERQWAGRVDDVYDRLAHHYSKASDPGRAITYLVHFAAKARQRYALADAARSLDQALGLVDALAVGEREHVTIEIVIEKAFVLNLMARLRDIIALLDAHRDRVEALGDSHLAGQFYFRLAMTYWYLADVDASERAARRASADAQHSGDRLVAGLASYVLSNLAANSRAGVDHGRRAVEDLQTVDSPLWLGFAYRVLGLNLTSMGQFDDAVASCTAAVRFGEAVHDVRLQSLALGELGVAEYFRNEPDRALDTADRAVTLAPDALAWGVTRRYRGWIHLELGDHAAALRDLESAVEAGDRDGIDAVMGRHLALLADAQQQAGQTAAAVRSAERAIACGIKLRAPWIEAWALRVLGRVALGEGDLATADDRLRATLSIFDSLQAVFEAARTKLALAEVAHARGRLDAAERLLAEAGDDFRCLRVPGWVERARTIATRLTGG